MCIAEIGSIAVEKSNVLSQFEKLVHGFTTRKGGVSKGEFESLSMSPWRGDDIENVRKNERILCESLSLEIKKLTATKQEHTRIKMAKNNASFFTNFFIINHPLG